MQRTAAHDLIARARCWFVRTVAVRTPSAWASGLARPRFSARQQPAFCRDAERHSRCQAKSIHQRPAPMQELEWRPRLIVFSVYQDANDARAAEKKGRNWRVHRLVDPENSHAR